MSIIEGGIPFMIITDSGLRPTAIADAAMTLAEAYRACKVDEESQKDASIINRGPATRSEAVTVVTAAQLVRKDITYIQQAASRARPMSKEEEREFTKRCDLLISAATGSRTAQAPVRTQEKPLR